MRSKSVAVVIVGIVVVFAIILFLGRDTQSWKDQYLADIEDVISKEGSKISKESAAGLRRRSAELVQEELRDTPADAEIAATKADLNEVREDLKTLANSISASPDVDKDSVNQALEEIATDLLDISHLPKKDGDRILSNIEEASRAPDVEQAQAQMWRAAATVDTVLANKELDSEIEVLRNSQKLLNGMTPSGFEQLLTQRGKITEQEAIEQLERLSKNQDPDVLKRNVQEAANQIQAPLGHLARQEVEAVTGDKQLAAKVYREFRERLANATVEDIDNLRKDIVDFTKNAKPTLDRETVEKVADKVLEHVPMDEETRDLLKDGKSFASETTDFLGQVSGGADKEALQKSGQGVLNTAKGLGDKLQNKANKAGQAAERAEKCVYQKGRMIDKQVQRREELGDYHYQLRADSAKCAGRLFHSENEDFCIKVASDIGDVRRELIDNKHEISRLEQERQECEKERKRQERKKKLMMALKLSLAALLFAFALALALSGNLALAAAFFIGAMAMLGGGNPQGGSDGSDGGNGDASATQQQQGQNEGGGQGESSSEGGTGGEYSPSGGGTTGGQGQSTDGGTSGGENQWTGRESEYPSGQGQSQKEGDQGETPSTGQQTDPSTGQQTDPSTGQATDPSTGQETDPSTGQQTDPSTGQQTDPSTGQETDPSTGQETDPSTGQQTEPAGWEHLGDGMGLEDLPTVTDPNTGETLEGLPLATNGRRYSFHLDRAHSCILVYDAYEEAFAYAFRDNATAERRDPSAGPIRSKAESTAVYRMQDAYLCGIAPSATRGGLVTFIDARSGVFVQMWIHSYPDYKDRLDDLPRSRQDVLNDQCVTMSNPQACCDSLLDSLVDIMTYDPITGHTADVDSVNDGAFSVPVNPGEDYELVSLADAMVVRNGLTGQDEYYCRIPDSIRLGFICGVSDRDGQTSLDVFTLEGYSATLELRPYQDLDLTSHTGVQVHHSLQCDAKNTGDMTECCRYIEDNWPPPADPPPPPPPPDTNGVEPAEPDSTEPTEKPEGEGSTTVEGSDGNSYQLKYFTDPNSKYRFVVVDDNGHQVYFGARDLPVYDLDNDVVLSDLKLKKVCLLRVDDVSYKYRNHLLAVDAQNRTVIYPLQKVGEPINDKLDIEILHSVTEECQ